MKAKGYSLVEVLVAAVVVGIGMTAAAVLIGSLTVQEEVNSATVRAANLQEQAVMLYRLGLKVGWMRANLPEVCTNTGTTPAADEFAISTTAISLRNLGAVSLDQTTLTVIYAMPTIGNATNVVRRTNTSSVLSLH